MKLIYSIYHKKAGLQINNKELVNVDNELINVDIQFKYLNELKRNRKSLKGRASFSYLPGS